MSYAVFVADFLIGMHPFLLEGKRKLYGVRLTWGSEYVTQCTTAPSTRDNLIACVHAVFTMMNHSGFSAPEIKKIVDDLDFIRIERFTQS